MNANPPKALAAAALLAVPVLSSCGVTFGAQTDQIYTPADGSNDLSGTVDVLNALIVSETPGSGRLIAGLANNDNTEADALIEVSGAQESEALTFTVEEPAEGSVEIPPAGLVQLADDESGVVLVSGDEEELYPGAFVRVTFTFERGDSATLNIPVLEPGTDYADVEIPEPGASTGAGTVTEIPEG